MNPTIISTAGAVGTFAALSYAGSEALPRKLGSMIAEGIEMVIGEYPLYMKDGAHTPLSYRGETMINWTRSKKNWQNIGIFTGLVAVGVLVGGAAQSGTQIRT